MKVYREITPLNVNDVYVLLDSVDKGFNYPIHNHPEFELTLILNSSGTRIVGDSTEKYYQNDLVLLGPYLYHKWDGGDPQEKKASPCRVITLQFDMNLFDTHILRKVPFHKVRKLLENSGRGIRFFGRAFSEARKMMVRMARRDHMADITGVIGFLKLLDLLSKSNGYEYLASEGFDLDAIKTDSERVQVAYRYILHNFTERRIRIGDVADQVNMSSSAFSHFFKKYTNKSFTQFLIDLRIGYACKLLIDTDNSVNQICFQSGFNNITNFNRLFKKYRSRTPREYRKFYKERDSFDCLNQKTPYQFLPSGMKIEASMKPKKYATKLVHS